MEADHLGFSRDLMSFIDGSPTPFHAVESAARLLDGAGFLSVEAAAAWPNQPGRYYLANSGGLVAWVSAGSDRPHAPFRIVGAHTDSPNIRIKPHPERAGTGVSTLGVEPYGSLLVNSWLDRDLSCAGRVVVRTPAGPEVRLVQVVRPVLRIPQLAIHLDRDLNDTGLKLDPQTHLSPMWGLVDTSPGGFARFVACEAGVEPDDLLAWTIMCHDTNPATFLGPSDELISAPRIDNLLSCHAAVAALIAVAERIDPPSPTPLIALFDHEEVGSVSATGAASPTLRTVMERVVAARGGDTESLHRSLAATTVLSADGAHATHPNYPERHDPNHHIALDGGPVLKVNANERYATSAESAATVVLAAEAAGVTLQQFVNRSDLACGSTIGPITSARLGVQTVDVGVAQLAMHSIRELVGSRDPARFAALLTEFLGFAAH